MSAIAIDESKHRMETPEMSDGSWVDWFPYVFFPFKVIVLGIGMYYAIKWHHDQAKKDSETKGR
ncbi:hypothetical protein RAC92_08865 [Agrobacterium sp. CR_3]|jgi:hypothetical protein|uniref:hypothetical protein n=1 Tax=Agrobacterium TaxID=357 RepID=UPI0011513669|nr:MULTISPECIES: hypothetical protein [Agrobacterium]MDP9857436.1 hypothetical protein [Agrobacterium tumefaciens]MDR6192504.1 hypothetical protein [Agrobacterium pusense]